MFEKLERLLLDGSLDTVPIHLESGSGQYQLPLTADEAQALYAYMPEYVAPDNSYRPAYLIKDSHQFNHTYQDLNSLLDTFNLAVTEGASLEMSYKTARGQIIFLVFRPLKLVYDSIENLYAVLAVSDGKINVYRLDHVISLKYSRERHPQEQTDLLSIVPNVWGRCFSDHPETVKVRFYKEGNVWEKVRKDLSYRSNRKIYEEDGYLYYEDVVYGINAF